MLKGLGILIGGIFVGAIGIEIVQKKYPGAMDKVYAGARRTASEIKDAFKSGYQKASQPRIAQA